MSQVQQLVRRVATLAVPIAVDLAMPAVYRRLAHRLGPQRGDVAGFVVYWSACFAIPAAILGPRRAAPTDGDRGRERHRGRGRPYDRRRGARRAP